MPDPERIFSDAAERGAVLRGVVPLRGVLSSPVPPSPAPDDEPITIDPGEDFLRQFDEWVRASRLVDAWVLPPPRSLRARVWRGLRAWVPGTLEWRFRRWSSRRQFVVSE